MRIFISYIFEGLVTEFAWEPPKPLKSALVVFCDVIGGDTKYDLSDATGDSKRDLGDVTGVTRNAISKASLVTSRVVIFVYVARKA